MEEIQGVLHSLTLCYFLPLSYFSRQALFSMHMCIYIYDGVIVLNASILCLKFSSQELGNYTSPVQAKQGILL